MENQEGQVGQVNSNIVSTPEQNPPKKGKAKYVIIGIIILIIAGVAWGIMSGNIKVTGSVKVTKVEAPVLTAEDQAYISSILQKNESLKAISTQVESSYLPNAQTSLKSVEEQREKFVGLGAKQSDIAKMDNLIAIIKDYIASVQAVKEYCDTEYANILNQVAELKTTSSGTQAFADKKGEIENKLKDISVRTMELSKIVTEKQTAMKNASASL